jgi:predicted transcriptional regulator
MKRTTVKIPDELEARLKHEAQRRGIPVSALVREALEVHVGRRRPRSFGAGRSGRSDISERIEEILASEAKR